MLIPLILLVRRKKRPKSEPKKKYIGRTRLFQSRYLAFKQYQFELVLDCIEPKYILHIKNIELLRIWYVKLWTHSIPGLSTKTDLQTLFNPSKKPELRTCLARNRPNLGPNLEKPNFKPFRTQVHYWTMNPPEPSKNPQLRTHEMGLTQH